MSKFLVLLDVDAERIREEDCGFDLSGDGFSVTIDLNPNSPWHGRAQLLRAEEIQALRDLLETPQVDY